MDIAIAQDASSASGRRGARSIIPDEDLSRLAAAVARLDATLLAADTSDALYDRWRAAARDVQPIRAKAARGRRTNAIILLAVNRETRADGAVCDPARSVATDPTGRVGRKKRPLSPTEITIQHFMEQSLSRRAAGVLPARGCRDPDDIPRVGPDERRHVRARQPSRASSRQGAAAMSTLLTQIALALPVLSLPFWPQRKGTRRS